MKKCVFAFIPLQRIFTINWSSSWLSANIFFIKIKTSITTYFKNTTNHPMSNNSQHTTDAMKGGGFTKPTGTFFFDKL